MDELLRVCRAIHRSGFSVELLKVASNVPTGQCLLILSTPTSPASLFKILMMLGGWRSTSTL